MVPTPRALAMHAQVQGILEQTERLLAHTETPDLATVTRSVAVQANDLLLGTLCAQLTASVRAAAPGVTMRFVAESHEDTPALREGTVDLELGQIQHTQPEVRIEPLLSDRPVGVVRGGHPLARRRPNLQSFAAAEHVVVSRRGKLHGPVDEILGERGLRRRVATCAPTVSGALFLLQATDLVGMAPERLASGWVQALGLHTFALPFDLPPLEIAMAWHPRHEADGVHTWLRQCVRDLVPVDSR